jgi:hypothetical protein
MRLSQYLTSVIQSRGALEPIDRPTLAFPALLATSTSSIPTRSRERRTLIGRTDSFDGRDRQCFVHGLIVIELNDPITNDPLWVGRARNIA